MNIEDLIYFLLEADNPSKELKAYLLTRYSSADKSSGKILGLLKQRNIEPISFEKIEAELTPDEWNSSLPFWLAHTHGNGYVYIIHFEEPYYHASHYTGYTTKLDKRVITHAKEYGSKLMRTIQQKQKKWIIARIFPNVSPLFEVYLKKVYKKVSHFCPFCKGSPAYRYFEGQHDKVTLKLLKKFGLSQYANYVRESCFRNKIPYIVEELLKHYITPII